jgi:2-iminobutanoate/2-iminopropanoate deaminase
VARRPYALWRRAGDFVIISGQLGVVPDAPTTTFVAGGAPEQLRQALTNARSVLAEAGATLADVVKTTLFLAEIDHFGPCNEVWLEFFDDPLPTRSAFAVAALPYGALVEVEAWAFRPL